MGKRKKMRKNPRTGRKTIYLGHRVRDTGEPGLDSLDEVRRISKAILEDYRKGRIDKKTASGRFARLHNTIIPRDSDFIDLKKVRALEIIEEYWDKL